ncbi:hypothetical protein ACFLWX_00275 [Chloroflexota bacterium]
MANRRTRQLATMSFKRGRAASPIRTGLFIRNYLLLYGEGSPADMHRALKEAIREENTERVASLYLKQPTYSSFLKYVHNLRRLGLIEFNGKEEPTIYPWLPMKKRYFSITDKGRTQLQPWTNPIRALGYK